MKAIFCEEINSLSIIQGEDAHHLINVLRIKEGDDFLILNGMGQIIKATATEIKKDQIFFARKESIIAEKLLNIHLAIGMPKKEAMEEVLRNSTELGISKILYFRSQFSQQDFEPNDRTKRVLISSLIQSNNPYLPILGRIKDINHLVETFSDYDKIIYFCSHSNLPMKSDFTLKKSQKILLVVGPEGGFSKQEEEKLINNQNMMVIHLNTPILRSPTAVIASAAWVLGKLP